MIRNRRELNEFLIADSKNYKSQLGYYQSMKNNLLCDPISDQQYIWKYIVALRHVEWCLNGKGIWRHLIMRLYWLRKLRKLSYITGFQIPPNTCGKGLTIWHWGAIIINQAVRIGDNCTLYPGVLLGHKSPEDGRCPIIGNNAFIGSGTKIIGDVKIGNNVTIGQNCVITHNVPDNTIIVVNNKENRILQKK